MSTGLLSSSWVPENFVDTSLTSDITAGDLDIFLDNVPTQSEGTLVIDPDSASSREIIYYSSKTSTKVVCPANGRGYDNTTATTHTAGTRVIMAPVADWFRSLTSLFTTTPNSWTNVGQTVSVASGYNKGNKEFDLTFGASVSSTLSAGMRLKLTRGTTAPTQCTDLESGSSQYANRASASLTGITFTDDFAVEAWIKLESYGSSAATSVLSRYNGTSGWDLAINTSGTVALTAYNASQSNFSNVVSAQSIPLNRWVHIAAQLDMSAFTNTATTSYITIDGVNVPASVSRAGTNPTALVQAGNLELGARNAGDRLFDGKIADARLWSGKRTLTEIRDNMNQQLVGNESNLVAYYKLNGNFNDSTANANNLTAQGSATATDADNPMKDTEYAIVTKVNGATVTVFTGTDHNIPNMTLSSPQYSTQRVPYGFPASPAKWTLWVGLTTNRNSTANTNWNSLTDSIYIPVGSWLISHKQMVAMESTVTSLRWTSITLSSTTSSETYPDLTITMANDDETAATKMSVASLYAEAVIDFDTATTLTSLSKINSTSNVNNAGAWNDFANTSSFIRAICAYL